MRLSKPFLFAMEEPELHVPPGMQRRLISQAVSIAEQTICTTHSPRVAAHYTATSVQILDRRPERLIATPMLPAPLDATATNARRKLFRDDRARLLEALMHHSVLIPEGRSEYEWFRLLSVALETGDTLPDPVTADTPAFDTVIGVVPTHDGAVADVYDALRMLRRRLVPLVDGDDAGAKKIHQLHRTDPRPERILRWRDGWTMEDAIGWILEGDRDAALSELPGRIGREFASIEDLMGLFKVRTGPNRLKTDYLAYEEVASVIGSLSGCQTRAAVLLKAVTLATLGRAERCDSVREDDGHSAVDSAVFRLEP